MTVLNNKMALSLQLKAMGECDSRPIMMYILLIFFCSLVTPAFAEDYQCTKYCNADCSEYFPSSEFSSCVSANVQCSCTVFSTKHPGGVFMLIVIVVMIILFVTCFCNRMCQTCNGGGTRNISRHAVVAQPVVSQISGNVPVHGSGSNYFVSSQVPANFIVLPPSAPPYKPTGDIPPEYLPPPAYNDCVLNMNGQK